MNDRQKVLFYQLQMAGLGLVVFIMAFVLEVPVFYLIGGGIFLFGLIRFFALRKMIDQALGSPDADGNAKTDRNPETDRMSITDRNPENTER